MATTRWMCLGAMVALAWQGGIAGCSAEGDGVQAVVPTTGGAPAGTGGSTSTGGQTVMGSGGTVVFATGGTSIGKVYDDGRVVGRLRDFPAGFPDYRPRFDTFQNMVKNHNNVDKDIVGPVGTAILSSVDQLPIYNLALPPEGSVTTWGPSHPGCGGVPCFDYWFRDVAPQPGTGDWRELGNRTFDFEIQLADPDGDGVWAFDNGGQQWFPLDGNPGAFGADDPDFPDHNYGFTLHIQIPFRYRAGQVFRFIGDDDVFVYINGTLVVNIGGIHEEVEDQVMLDGLALNSTKVHTLDFFFAERNPILSDFRIETSIAPDDWELPE